MLIWQLQLRDPCKLPYIYLESLGEAEFKLVEL